jgi:copper(I)-binding protein
MSNNMIKRVCVSWLLMAASLSCAADPVAISHAWARATAPGQDVGAAYLELKSATDLTLTKAESPAASSVEVHKMSMKDGVMEMRMLETLELPAGQTVKLEPGGFHLMLFDLKMPLKAGESTRMTLHFKDKNGKESSMKIDLPIKRSAD